jgi:S1-C subfamily serine protease
MVLSLAIVCLSASLIFQLTLPFSVQAQGDIRSFRGVNRIIFAARKMAISDNSAREVLTLQQGIRYELLSHGAGCFVSGNLMLTANHVVSQPNASYFIGWSGDKFPEVSVQSRDEKLDLALVKFSAPDSNYSFFTVPFADSKPIVEGTDIFIWAYLEVAGGFMQFLRSGTISNNSDQELGLNHTVYVETTAIDGTSGSPVILRDGRPLGIVSAKLTVGGAKLPSGILAIVPGEQVNQFLRESGVPGY